MLPTTDELGENLQVLRRQLQQDIHEAHNNLLQELRRLPTQATACPAATSHSRTADNVCAPRGTATNWSSREDSSLAQRPRGKSEARQSTESTGARRLSDSRKAVGSQLLLAKGSFCDSGDPVRRLKGRSLSKLALAAGRTLADLGSQVGAKMSGAREVAQPHVLGGKLANIPLPESPDAVVPIQVNPEPQPLKPAAAWEPTLGMTVTIIENEDDTHIAPPIAMNSIDESLDSPDRSFLTASSVPQTSSSKRVSNIVTKLNAQKSLHLLAQNSDAMTDDEEETSLLKRMVDCQAFDAFFTLIIVLNALTIGLQTDEMARQGMQVVPRAYLVFDRVFCLMFSIELCLRFAVHRSRFFAETGLAWGVFDCCVVFLHITEQLLQLLPAWDKAGEAGASTSSGMSFVRTVRVIRLIRILRIIRIIRFVDELRTLVTSIMSSLRSLFWTVMLLFLGIYIVGIYFTQVVLDLTLATAADGAVIDATPDLQQHFGDMSLSMLSLYQAMSGGVDWEDLSTPLVNISVFQGFVFVTYITFTVLALTNVVTGVFVEGALRTAKREEEEVLLESLRRLFWKECSSEDGESLLNKDQFQQRLQDPQLVSYLQKIQVDPAEANLLFTLFGDGSDSGTINYEEWVSGCMRLRGGVRAIDTMVLLYEVVEMRRDLDAYREWAEDLLTNIASAVQASSSRDAAFGHHGL